MPPRFFLTPGNEVFYLISDAPPVPGWKELQVHQKGVHTGVVRDTMILVKDKATTVTLTYAFWEKTEAEKRYAAYLDRLEILEVPVKAWAGTDKFAGTFESESTPIIQDTFVIWENAKLLTHVADIPPFTELQVSLDLENLTLHYETKEGLTLHEQRLAPINL